MRDSAYRISLDIHEVQSQVSLPVKLGDTARRIYITLTENGKPFEIDNECVAIFSAIKSDGKKITNDCIIEDNRIRYDITAQTVAAEGIVSAEIILYGSDEAVLVSPRFDLMVDDRAAGVATISEDEKNFFDSFILSEQERVSNEQNRIKEFNNLGLSVEDDGDNYKLIKTNKDGSKKEYLIAKGKNGENGKDYVITSADYAAIADKVATDNLEESAEKYIDGALAEMDLDITKSASGNTITIDSAKAPLQRLKLFGKTTQNGTPTPEAPVPLVSVGDSGSFEVGVYGKNLLENLATTKTVNGITFTINADKSITINGTASATTMFNVNTTIKLDGTYILSGCPSEVSQQGVEWLFHDGAWQRDMGSGKTFTTSKAKAQKCVINISSGKTITNATIYPMIRLATETDSTYEPCNKQTLTMPFKLPNGNEVDFGKGTRKEKTVLLTVNGSEDWSFNSQYNSYYFYPAKHNVLAKRNVGMSTHFQQKQNADLCFFVSGGQNPISIYDLNGKWANTDALKSWLSENNVTFLFELETPIETPLTETELNAYRQLMTNKGTTTILSECEDTEITYYINKPNAQAIGSLHEQINKDYIKLQQAIISTGGST